MMFGEQAAIAQAIDEIHTLGDVTQETFQRIIEGAGPAGPSVEGLVRAYFDLEKATRDTEQAQSELNAVTEEYSAKLSPLKAQMASIQDQKQAIKDQERLVELQGIIADSTSTANEKRLAQLEMEEIATRNQIKAVEQERDVAVDAAKQKLDAAKSQQAAAQQQVESQKALLDAQNKQNAMIAEQTKAIEAASKSMGGHAAAAKVGAQAQTEMAATVAKVGDTISTATKSVTDISNTITNTFKPAAAAGGAAFSVLSSVIAGVMGTVRSIIDSHGSMIVSTVTNTFNTIKTVVSAVIGAVVQVVGAGVGLLVQFWTQNGANILRTVITTWSQIQGIINDVLRIVAALVVAVLGQVTAFINSHGQQIVAVLGGAWSQIADIVRVAIQIIQQVVIPGLAAIVAFVMTHGQQIQTILGGVWQMVASLIQGALGFIQGIIHAVLAAIQGDWAGAWASLQYACASAVQGVIGIVSGFLNVIAGFFGTSLNELANLWAGNWAKLGAFVQDAMTGIHNILTGNFTNLTAAFTGWIGTISSLMGGLPGQMIQVGADLVNGIRAGIEGQWNNFLGWIRDKVNMIPEPVRQALGISSPSKVFADIGKQILEGLIQGIEEMAPNVDRKLLTIFSETIGAMMQALSTAFELIGDLRGFVAPSLNEFYALIDTLGAVMTKFVDTARAIKMRASIAETIEIVGTGFASLFDIMAGALAVSKDIAEVTALSQKNIDIFADNMMKIFNAFMDVADAYRQKTNDIYLASNLVSFAATILEGISGAAEAFVEIADTSALTKEQVDIFAENLHLVILKITEVANKFLDEGVVKAANFADATIVVMEMLTAGAEAFAALAALGDIPSSAIDQFAQSITAVMTELTRVAAQFETEALAAAVYFASSASVVLSVIQNGVDGLSALATMPEVGVTAAMRFGLAIMNVITYIDMAAQQFSDQVIGRVVTFSASVQQVVGMIGVAVENLTALDGFGNVSVASIQAFGLAINNVVWWLDLIAQQFTQEMLDRATAFANAAGAVVGIIKSAVENLAALGELGAVSNASIMNFGVSVNNVVWIFGLIGAQFTEEMLTNATAFANAATTVLGIIATGVENLGSLADYLGTPIEAMQRFSADVQVLIDLFADVSANFETVVLDRAVAFAEAAQAILDVIGSGVESLSALSGYSGVALSRAELFAQDLRQVVYVLVKASEDFTSDLLNRAVEFANAAKIIVETIGAGVESLAKLNDYPGVATSRMQEFLYDLVLLVDMISHAAMVFQSEALGHAIEFANAAGAIVDMIASGVEGIGSLADFKEVPISKMQAFVSDVKQLVMLVAEAATAFSTEGLNQAAIFADAARDALAMIGDSVEGLATINDFKPVPIAKMQAFVNTIRQFVDLVSQAATLFTNEGLEKAAAFGAAATEIIGMLKEGAEGLESISNFKAVPIVKMQAFVTSISQFVDLVAIAAQRFTVQGLAHAKTFGDAATEIIGILQEGAEGLASIANFKPVPIPKMQAFTNAIGQFMDLVLVAAARFTAAQLDIVKTFSQNVIQVVQDISDAIDALSTLGGIKAGTNQLVAAFIAAVTDLVNRFRAAIIPPTAALGAAIIEGIAAGITANAAKLRDALLAAVNAALAAVKAALQIASPSKVFADQIGVPIAEGIMLGVQARAVALSSSLRGLAGTALGAAGSSISNTNYTVNATYRNQDERSVRDDLVLMTMLQS
jgi:phage-related protein